MIKKIPTGSRGTYLYLLFHEAVNNGKSKDETLEILFAANLKYCSPPRTDNFIKRTHRKAWERRMWFHKTFSIPLSVSVTKEKRLDLLSKHTGASN